MRPVSRGARFENPFILASGPPTENADMLRRAFEAGWSGAVVKTITRSPGRNLHNRFASLRGGGRVMGFENLELLSERCPDEWFSMIANVKREFPAKIIIGSIMGDARSPDNWILLAKGCQEAGADLLELNFSCPHGYPERGEGSAIGQNATHSATITRWLTECAGITIPIIPKLTAQTADIQSVGEAVAKAGADGACAINTVPSFFGIDVRTLRPRPDIHGLSACGGYSGPGIKPIALRAVAHLCQSPGLPVMACGGISSGFDAAEFMLLGAPVVQVCTEVMLNGYGVINRMKSEIAEFMNLHGFGVIGDFVGRCKKLVVPFGQLSATHMRRAKLLPEKCVSCGACRTACRDGAFQAISWAGNLPIFDPNRCVGCSLCSHVCEHEAIVMDEINESA